MDITTISRHNNHIPMRDVNTSFSLWLKTHDYHVRSILDIIIQTLPEIRYNDANFIKVASAIYNQSSKVV